VDCFLFFFVLRFLCFSRLPRQNPVLFEILRLFHLEVFPSVPGAGEEKKKGKEPDDGAARLCLSHSGRCVERPMAFFAQVGETEIPNPFRRAKRGRILG